MFRKRKQKMVMDIPIPKPQAQTKFPLGEEYFAQVEEQARFKREKWQRDEDPPYFVRTKQ